MNDTANPANLIHRRTAQRDRFRRVARYQRETLSATVDVLEQTRAELAVLRAWKPANTAFVSIEKYRALQADMAVLAQMVTIADMEGDIQYSNLRRRAEQEIEVTRRKIEIIRAEAELAKEGR